MTNKKKHLTFEERFLIEKLLKTKSTITFIASALDRGISTITEEVRTGGGLTRYSAKSNQERAAVKQRDKKKRYNKVLLDINLKSFVIRKTKKGQSPESISRLLKNNISYKYASSKSIRKFLNQITRIDKPL